MVRCIKTRSSLWSFDEEKMEFNRSPLVADTEHPNVAYTGQWEPYTSYTEPYDDGDVVQFVVATPSSTTGILVSSYHRSEQD